MGCDIHLYVEKRVNGVWVTADNWVTEDDRTDVDYGDRFYSGRSYNLFAILADVRNGHGFAGVKTDDGFNIISQPKGLPSDVCKEIKQASDDWDIDGHSHSYHTLTDLFSFNWTQMSQEQGVISAIEFERWDSMKRWEPAPESWCASISGLGIKFISETDMRRKINEIRKRLGNVSLNAIREVIESELGRTHTTVTWSRTYASCCQEFWWKTIPALLRLGNSDDVRIVFWFDN